jgi:hypothetical protein
LKKIREAQTTLKERVTLHDFKITQASSAAHENNRLARFLFEQGRVEEDEARARGVQEDLRISSPASTIYILNDVGTSTHDLDIEEGGGHEGRKREETYACMYIRMLLLNTYVILCLTFSFFCLSASTY